MPWRPERRRAALADDLAGDALAKVALAVAVGQQRGARLPLHVDEARRRPSARSHRSRGRPRRLARSPIRVMRSPVMPTSARCGGWPRAVDDLPATDDQIETLRGRVAARQEAGQQQSRTDEERWECHLRATIIVGLFLSHTPYRHLLPSRTSTRGLFSADDYAQMRAFFATPRRISPPTPTTALPAAGRASSGSARCPPRMNPRDSASTRSSCSARDSRSRRCSRKASCGAGATVVCASEGNHGRAVARAARDAGCAARVYMAHDAAQARVDAIAGEGAEVVRVDGSLRRCGADPAGRMRRPMAGRSCPTRRGRATSGFRF